MIFKECYSLVTNYKDLEIRVINLGESMQATASEFFRLNACSSWYSWGFLISKTVNITSTENASLSCMKIKNHSFLADETSIIDYVKFRAYRRSLFTRVEALLGRHL